jgi:uncharacterized protein with ParB-like and HNH nuclease domain
MAELIYSTKDVFTSYLKGRTYKIPEYQRGFKWSNKQIEQLLSDISDFDDKLDDDLFYCLQNITLYSSKLDKNVLNIVDGQQRLTTTFLLYCFLELEEFLHNKLNYAVRESSNIFINKLQQDRQNFIKTIIDSNSFDDFCESFKDEDFDYQDIFYMYSALKTFEVWFSKPNTNIELFKEKFCNKVKFIVNEIHSDIKEQELFMNLNTGKIPLDGADLIRAIIITRVARDEMQDSNPFSIKDIVRLNEKRTRIGWELDQLNQWWSNKNVKNYFRPFQKIEADIQETIIFNSDINPINILYSLWAETKVKHKENLRLKLFENSNISSLSLYKELSFLNRTLQDWFKDRELYHLLGYLANNYRSFSFSKYYNLWLSPNQTRELFIETIKSDIKKYVFGDEEKVNSGAEFWLQSILNYNGESKTNWYDLQELEKFLVLIDVIEISKNKETLFLSPVHFKKNNEDKEHIYPCTPKNIKEIEKCNNEFEAIQTYLSKIKDLTADIFPYQELEWNKKEIDEKEEILKNIESKVHEKTPINSIGNLVLLHYSINRGFGNDYYIDKRASVVNNVQNGEYVRQHTLSVFVKGRSNSSNLNDWNFEDIEKNADFIEQSIRDFFELKKEKDEQQATA